MGGRYQGTYSLGHCNLTSPTSDSPPLLLLHLLQRRAGSCSVLWQADFPPPFQGLSSISQPVRATGAPAPYACIAPAAPASCWDSFDLTHTRTAPCLSVLPTAYCLPCCHCPAFACLHLPAHTYNLISSPSPPSRSPVSIPPRRRRRHSCFRPSSSPPPLLLRPSLTVSL